MNDTGRNREDQDTAHRIARLAYSRPPRDLTPDIMAAVRKRRSRWQRTLHWMLTPRAVRIAPLWPATALAAAALLLVLAPLLQQPVLQPIARSEAPNPISFRLAAAQARHVAVIGSFNDWQQPGYDMSRDATGTWTLTIPLSRGRYEYAFVIDGSHIIPDPTSLLQRDDGFGNINSVLTVDDYETHHML